ncbi:MAG: hypothetical protein GTO45_01385, partial [Candidatus Aminicenantes bacterium]|nr:hypothetical protein [Candidatus Aminicenantes bacterium]NIN16719.1 hypothetical protein [Candidatus Aminicenantes bacterium]NIN40575.1 hypothetical protein [Candidatus Aminicenantes bacterium]NIN83396.1 hypothetical protein [Candidatus Aminicenantes bacterium]NIO79236.1 hypothetical protein [Candidatus Aminicenantes bacterium]
MSEDVTDTNVTNVTNVSTVVTQPKTRKRSRSMANLLKKGENMAAGIQEHLATLSPKLDETDVQNLRGVVEACSGMDDDQEILKGTLKAKTAELEAKIEELKDVISRYTLIIKATV